MFFKRSSKKKPYVEYVRDGLPFELESLEYEPAIVHEMRLRTEAAWQEAVDEINREKKALLLAEYRDCLRLYRRQVLLSVG